MKAEELNPMAKSKSNGIDQILDDIRDVISNSPPNTDVLELTERVSKSATPDGVQNANAPVQTKNAAADVKVEDILAKLDLMPQESAAKNTTNSAVASPQQSPQQIVMPQPQISLSAAEGSLLNQAVIEQSKRVLLDVLRQQEHDLHKSGVLLEDVVTEILKPQLSDWLNKNLPEIVSNIVQKEIKKIIP